MSTIVDHHNVVLFNDLIKIYLFKEEKKVKVSFKITDYLTTHFAVTQEQFEEWAEVQYKKYGIRVPQDFKQQEVLDIRSDMHVECEDEDKV